MTSCNCQRLLDRVAIVTGAGSGMGAGAAIGMGAQGAKVVAVDLNTGAAEATAQQIVAAGGQALGLGANVVDPAAVRRMVDATVERFGTVDILVSCAGVLRSSRVEDIGEAEWDLVVDVNLKGVFLCCQAVLPIMKAKRYGKIVIMASLAGRATSTLGGAHYTASKAGVLGLARHLAREVAPFQINVNAINPGIIDTPMIWAHSSPERLEQVRKGIPFGRFGTTEDVSNLIVFLSSDESSYITGAGVDIHGGELII